MNPANQVGAQVASIRVDVVEGNKHARRGWLPCRIGEHVRFSTERLETYCFASWNPLIYDAMLVAAAVEFADRTRRRGAWRWEREIDLRIPVHFPEHWNGKQVSEALHNALKFLTGDVWRVSFHQCTQPPNVIRQNRLDLPAGLTSVIPFSDGLDSRVVAGLMERELGDKLILVRLGSNLSGPKQPFTSVPYSVRAGLGRFSESSARSRGFKFSLISGLAAFLAKASEVIVPESGQGAIGPALVTVGQAYEDYRTHPFFAQRMELFLEALLGCQIRFRFPRLWYTKGETLNTFIKKGSEDTGWSRTWSCWQQTRQVSVDHKKRQCGICAACMLRRLSVHAAGLVEPAQNYVWEDLSASAFEKGAASSFPQKKITGKLRQYAIAGALHLDHLASLRESKINRQTLKLHAFQLSGVLGLPEEEARVKLDRLLIQHSSEWKSFLHSLGPNSFLADWAVQGNS